MSSSSNNNNSDKIRVLVLHGFYDSADNRSIQMRSLVKVLKDIQFVFINSPFKFIDYGFLNKNNNKANNIDNKDNNNDNNDGMSSDNDKGSVDRYQWMSYDPNKYNNDPSNYEYDTIKESILYIIDYINNNGPFHGILGFSQGGIIVATIMLIHSIQLFNANNTSNDDNKLIAPFDTPSLPSCIKSFIMVGSPMIGDHRIKPLLSNSKSLPCLPNLHIAGLTDPVIPLSSSKSLCESFQNSTFYTHKNGHIVPSNSEARATIKNFIHDALKETKPTDNPN